MATDAAVQVLTERVSHAIDDLKEMKGQLASVNQGVVLMAALQERVNTIDGKTNRLFEVSDATKTEIGKLSSQMDVHSRMWKLIGTALLACIGVLGWAATQYGNFRDLAARVSVLERVTQERTK
ncbi:hypothetical protein [Ralstonia pickettii]|uniref:hypothetical protein n=1 Tax=Ralstonia pickettii TaxID=329 RepID=UPI0015FCDEE7|nr:hypothetical protein [Ralstonia pickettii]MBB0026839.1 hypothetical protein [Ralstonia pickettii]MBB0034663.1 hypothetical protein [Ralstonia pickettii]MBB0100002.1 hypothetical protein [Ralstonia pickettii]MBB0109961.1 hypothetical protein [Ralstonia pickettii]MBB0130941.1 hypothetical protein [Ralstonia pickettii]